MRLLRCAAVGALAGAVGTAAMDAVWYSRHRREGGTDSWWAWETSAGLEDWEKAPAPGQVGRKVLEALTHRPPPARWARATTNVVHWATGVGWGMQLGVAVAVAPRHRTLLGLAVGPVAWSASYVLLPLAKVYKPIWKYDARTLGKDLSAHLVFGGATSATFRALNSRAR